MVLLRVRTKRAEAKAGAEGCVDPLKSGFVGDSGRWLQNEFTDDARNDDRLQHGGRMDE